MKTEGMTIKEFLIWLDGFKNSFDETIGPNGEQWTLIKTKLESLEELKPVPFIPRFPYDNTK